MTVLKAFFFDLDGTLVNTHQANTTAYGEAIRQIAYTDPSDQLFSYIARGESSKVFLPKAVKGASNELVDAINAKKKELYPSALHMSELNAFLVGFLKQMYETSTTVLVTTAKRDNALAVLRHHNIEKYFTHLIFGEDVERMKPDPDAYLLALKKTALSHDEVLAFEDSEKGIAAAEAAGIAVVHIRTFES